MGLLYTLFPRLLESSSEGIPRWDKGSHPWELFFDSERGILAQIVEITGEVDGVFIHPSAEIGECVKIEGPCYIGKNTVVRHSAYLRKGTWMCEGSLVGHSTEVKNSILLPKSKAPHFNYVGDSILGFGVNLGAGAKLSNVRNDRREVIVTLEGGSKLETGLRKFGALVGDESQLGCNVVTNPGVLICPGTLIPPNETVTGWRD